MGRIYLSLSSLTHDRLSGIDTRVVNRSNAVQGWRYGEGFLFSERLRVANPLVAALVSVSMAAAGILLLIPPLRALLKSVLYKPGAVVRR